MPVVEHDGRLWRAVEQVLEPGEYPGFLGAFLLSVPVEADLLRAASWSRTEVLPFDARRFPGQGWLEGNAVVAPNGRVVNVLRVDLLERPERAFVLELDAETSRLVPVDDEGVVLPGAAKKFTIRFDERTGRYWTLVNAMDPEIGSRLPSRVRNRLALASSTDLSSWLVHATLLHHPDPERHGFQYADLRFDEDDLVFVARTAYDDAHGGADDYHNANYITFHRVIDFRSCVEMVDSTY